MLIYYFFQTRKIADAEVDSNGDIAGVCISDLAAVLRDHQ